MSEMMDRVAQALYDDANDGDPAIPWAETLPPLQTLYRRYARAAILALREPTTAMIAATTAPLIAHHLGDGIYDLREPCLRAVYQAMIDEAARTPEDTR